MSAHWVTPRTMNIGVSQRAWERAGIGCSECVNASGPANVKKKGPAFPPLETVKSRAFHPSITLEERHSLRPGRLSGGMERVANVNTMTVEPVHDRESKPMGGTQERQLRNREIIKKRQLVPQFFEAHRDDVI